MDLPHDHYNCRRQECLNMAFLFPADFRLAVNKDVRVLSEVFRNLKQTGGPFYLLEANSMALD